MTEKASFPQPGDPLVNHPEPPTQRMEGLIKLFQRANAEQKQMLKEAMGIKEGITKRKSRQNNANARLIVSQVGECIHTDEFKVMPSEAIYNKGPAAVAAFYERHASDASRPLSNQELEDLAAAAVE